MRPDYPLKTDRLLLRPYQPEDLDDFLACRLLPEIYPYLDGDVPDRATATELFAAKLTHHELTEQGQRLTLAVYCPEAQRVIGDVVLMWHSEQHRQGELGYIFDPEFHGKGLAREAAAKALELGFDELKLHRIIAQCDPRNEPSWRLMERLGMRREAHYRHNEIFKGEWGDLFVYALLEEEYESAP